MSQYIPLVLGAGSLVLAYIHLTAGEREIARPILDSSVSPVAKRTMYVCWHAVSAHLLGAGVALLAAALWAGPVVAQTLVVATSVLYLTYAALFLIIGWTSGISGAWRRLGQWMAFLPLGLFGLIAP